MVYGKPSSNYMCNNFGWQSLDLFLYITNTHVHVYIVTLANLTVLAKAYFLVIHYKVSLILILSYLEWAQLGECR